MNTTRVGRRAELAVVEYLTDHGFRILAKNWRTRYCEIDIVARRDQTVYFIEVKYRSSGRQGTGLDYITHRKKQQMVFAANLWMAKHRWVGSSDILAVEVNGPDYIIGRRVRIA